MNLFNKIYKNVEEIVTKIMRERQLKAGYKTRMAELEEQLLDCEIAIEKRVANDNWNFCELVESYESIQIKKEQIRLTQETYEYLFNESAKEV